MHVRSAVLSARHKLPSKRGRVGRGQGGSAGEHRDIGGGRVILVSSLVQLAMLPFVAFCRHLSRLEHFGRGGAVFSVAWASGTIKIAS